MTRWKEEDTDSHQRVSVPRELHTDATEAAAALIGDSVLGLHPHVGAEPLSKLSRELTWRMDKGNFTTTPSLTRGEQIDSVSYSLIKRNITSCSPCPVLIAGFTVECRCSF